MPSDLTIFAARYLVFIDALLALGVLAWLQYRRPRPAVLRWIVAVAIMLVLSYAFAKIGAAIYNDPRPFTQDHVKPLISHAPDNGFPSDHALLAAAIVAAVAMVSPVWCVPFVILAALVDWSRVGAGIHHVQDVVGSSLLVLVATLVALLLAGPIAGRLTPQAPTLAAAAPQRYTREPDEEGSG
jgi:undecaprenyl-diphosphatase